MVRIIIKREHDIREIYKRRGFGSDNYTARQVLDKITSAITKELGLKGLPYSVVVSDNAGFPVLELRNDRTGEVIAREEDETEEIKKLLDELDDVVEVML